MQWCREISQIPTAGRTTGTHGTGKLSGSLSLLCFFACLPVSLQPPASLCKPAFSAYLSALGCLIRVTPRMAVLSLESLSVIACTGMKVCKTYITKTHSTGFDSVVRGRGMRFYISNKFSNDSDYLGMQFENDGSIWSLSSVPDETKTWGPNAWFSWEIFSVVGQMFIPVTFSCGQSLKSHGI